LKARDSSNRRQIVEVKTPAARAPRRDPAEAYPVGYDLAALLQDAGIKSEHFAEMSSAAAVAGGIVIDNGIELAADLIAGSGIFVAQHD